MLLNNYVNRPLKDRGHLIIFFKKQMNQVHIHYKMSHPQSFRYLKNKGQN